MGNKKFKETHLAMGLCLFCCQPVYRGGRLCKKHTFSNAAATNRYDAKQRALKAEESLTEEVSTDEAPEQETSK